MAQRVLTTLIDDLDGTEANETVKFGLDGADLEIDLSKANAEKLRGILAPYAAKARRVGRATAPKAYGGKVTKAPVVRSLTGATVRAWAASPEGVKVLQFHELSQPGAKGRLPGDLVKLYENRDEEEAALAARDQERQKRETEAQNVTPIKAAPKPRARKAAPAKGGEGTAAQA